MSDACASALAITTRCFSPPLKVANARVSSAVRARGTQRVARDLLVGGALELERAEVRVAAHQHHVEHAEVEGRVRVLGHDRDPAGEISPRQLLDRPSVEPHASGERFQDARDDAQQRRLAGAVRTEQADDRAPLDLERHAVSMSCTCAPCPRGRTSTCGRASTCGWRHVGSGFSRICSRISGRMAPIRERDVTRPQHRGPCRAPSSRRAAPSRLRAASGAGRTTGCW